MSLLWPLIWTRLELLKLRNVFTITAFSFAFINTTGWKNVTVIFKIFFLTLKIHFHSLLNFFSVDEWKQFAKENPDVIKNIAVSSGTSDNDYEKIKVKESLQIKIIMRFYSCMYVFFGTFRLLLLLFLKLPSFAWTWQTVTLNTSCNTLEKFVRLLRLKP